MFSNKRMLIAINKNTIYDDLNNHDNHYVDANELVIYSIKLLKQMQKKTPPPEITKTTKNKEESNTKNKSKNGLKPNKVTTRQEIQNDKNKTRHMNNNLQKKNE